VIGELLRLALPPGSVPARYVRAASAIHLVESDGWQLVERLDGGEPAEAAGGS
jgi:hypothetical protein